MLLIRLIVWDLNLVYCVKRSPGHQVRLYIHRINQSLFAIMPCAWAQIIEGFEKARDKKGKKNCVSAINNQLLKVNIIGNIDSIPMMHDSEPIAHNIVYYVAKL